MDLTLILQWVIHAATPILFVALGELILERSGILNLGLEGMMMIGALSGFYFAYMSNNPALGIFMAALITGGFALIHGFISITLHANQVVSGLALTFLGTGLSSFLGRNFVNKKAISIGNIDIPFLSGIPFMGKIFFDQNILVYLSFALIILLSFFLYKTRSGLRLQFCGDNPACADTAGVNVSRYRYAAVIFGGLLAGIGGAFLTVADNSPWSGGVVSGRGWIAVAIVIFGRWNPIGVAAGSYIFGALSSLQFKLQARNIMIPSDILSMLPYMFTIVILSITSIKMISKRFGTPAALGEPYFREERE